MSMITASFTTPATDLYTRSQILNAFLRRSGIGTYGTIDGSTATNDFTDKTRLANYYIPSDAITGAWARISYDAGGSAAAPETEIRSISSLSQGNAKVTLQYPFSAQAASGDKYQIFKYLHPQEVIDELDNILTETAWLPCWTILTEVPDGDMEQSHTTDWTGTNATLAKATAQPVMWGRRYLTVATTSAGGYASPSTSIKVVPGKKYHLSAITRANAASCTPTLTAYDLTNSAQIATVTTTSLSKVRIWTEFTVPATCYSIGLRMGNAENSVTSSWDEVCFFCMEGHDIAAPWWTKGKDSIKEILYSNFHTAGASSAWDPVPNGGPDLNRWDYVDSGFGTSQNRIVSRHGNIYAPLYVFGIRNEEAYANDNSEQKRLDFEWTVVALQKRCFEIIKSNSMGGETNKTWIDAKLEDINREYRKLTYKQHQKAEEAITAEGHDQLFFKQNFGHNILSYDRLVN